MVLLFYKDNSFWGLKKEDESIYLSANYNDLTVFISDKKGQVLDSFKNPSVWIKGASKKIEVASDNSTFFLVKRNGKSSLISKAHQTNNENDLINHFQEYPQLESESRFKKHTSKSISKFYSDILYIGNGLFKVKIIDIYKKLVINREDDESETVKYDKFHWILIDLTGTSVNQEKYQHIDAFRNELCKVKVNGVWNFITPETKYALSNWYSQLDYPLFAGNKFLASKLKYEVSYLLSNKYSVFKIVELFKEIDDNFGSIFKSDSVYENGIKGSDKIKFSSEELKYILAKFIGTEITNINIQETVDLDIYDTDGFVKKLGVKEISLIPVYEDDNESNINDLIYVATVSSIFIADYNNNGSEINKIYRNTDSKLINGINGENLWVYQFDEQRLLDKNGEFIGNNHYHEIRSFKNGLAKVSKLFFLCDTGLKIDTSLNEIEFNGLLEVSKPQFGFIDNNGNEIIECKYYWLDDYRDNKCHFELEVDGDLVTGFLDEKYKEHFE